MTQFGNTFSKFVDEIVGSGIDLEHPDESTMAEIIRQGKVLGLNKTESWQAYLTASERKSLIEQEIMEGGSGQVAKKTSSDKLRNIRYGEKEGDKIN